MTRVLVVLNGVLGGANRSAADLVRHLPPERYEGCIAYPTGFETGVDALRAACPRTAAVYLPMWRRLNRPILERIRQGLSRNIRSGAHIASGLRLRKLCREWDVGLIHTNTSTTLTPALTARALGLPHVWHVRELIGSQEPFSYLWNDRTAARAFAALSDRIIANSEQSAAFFREHLGDDAVTIIPNGLPEPERDPAISGAQLRASLGIPPSAVVVGMAASLSSPVKNHRHTLDAVAPLLRQRPGTFFVLYGDVPDTPYAGSIKAAVEALGPSGRLAAHVQDPWAIMGSIDILAHGTASESFGRVFVEAMLAGKPVVAPRGGGALTIIRDGETGFLTDPADPSDMTRYLTRLVDDPDLRRDFGAAGQARARARFSLSAHVNAVCSVYDELLDRGSAIQKRAYSRQFRDRAC
jgi:glycosyltransferase involved in cell wall biosynthesis